MDKQSRNIIILALAAAVAIMSVALLKPDAMKLPEAAPPPPPAQAQ